MTKLKYIGKEIVYLRMQNSSMKLKPNQTFNVTKRQLERFKTRKDFKKVK